MTRFGWLVLIIVLLVISGIISGWYLIMRYHAPIAVQGTAATSTPEMDLSQSSIYTNGVYGFSLIYPAKDAVADTFSPWRSGATATGTPIVVITDPDGTLRIGASTSAKEVKACAKADPAETSLADLQLGSTTFKAFVRDNMGTDNQQRITSYRAIHEKSCVAIETLQAIQNGSVATSTRLAGMIQGFSFARP
ncbi:MAG: hypothetical protein JWL88_549 [Parcubacteria group bacterium]|nr:hypothetical protein [Parcubacteria group bacterium]